MLATKLTLWVVEDSYQFKIQLLEEFPVYLQYCGESSISLVERCAISANQIRVLFLVATK
jgi:hypothetical protein